MPDARKKAIDCLIRCERGGYSNLVLLQELDTEGLDRRDRAFCTALFYGTLSRLITLDGLLSRFSSKPLLKLDTEVLSILRAGAYQIFWMDSVPARAAVSESVKLCRAFGKSSASGFVNAVLRKCSSADIGSVWRDVPEGPGYLSLRYSVCEGLSRMLYEQYGSDAGPMLDATLRRADSFVRVNTLLTDTASAQALLKSEGVETEPFYMEGCLRVTSGSPVSTAPFKNGLVRMQSLPAQYAAFSAAPAAGGTFLDMCSAPGGKTATVAQLMENRGSITAVDSSDVRLRLVSELAVKEHADIVSTVCADASELSLGQKYSSVLCDVPCSGYGEIDSKPELRYKDPSVSEALPELQYRILCNAAEHTAPGGKLVYSTCTVLKRENQDITDRFIAEHSDFRYAEPAAPPPGAHTDEGKVSFVPGACGTEGFFVAVFSKM